MKEKIRITFRKEQTVEIRPTAGSFLNTNATASGLIVSPVIRVIRPQKAQVETHKSGGQKPDKF